MAKYRITSIPQSLPEARNGGSTKLKKFKPNTFQNWMYPILHPKDKAPVIDQPVNQPITEVQGVQQPSYWNDMQSPVARGEECPPGKYPYNGECLTESEYIAASNKEMEDWQRGVDEKKVASDQRFQESISQIRKDAQEEQDRWYKDDVTKYYENFEKSAKGDKIEPFRSLPTTDISKKVPVLDQQGNPVLGEDGNPLTETVEDQLKKSFLIHKNDRGYTDLFPKDIAYKRIVNNGFQADQFKNYWGLDPKQVESQMGDVMKAADAQYTGDVTQHIINKAIDQGKTTDEVISGLSPKVGTKSGLKNKFAKPTQKIIDDTYAQIKEQILNGIPGVDQTKTGQDADVFLYSDNPQDAWERKYHNGETNLGDFLNYQGKKIEKGTKAYNDYMTKYGNVGQGVGQEYVNKDDAFADIRANNSMMHKVLNEKNASNARLSAESEDFQKAFQDYMGNYSADELKYVIDKMLNDAGTDQKSKLKVLQALKTDPDGAIQNLLQQKAFSDSDETYADLYQQRVTDLYNGTSYAPKNEDTVKAWDGVNENDSGLSKFLDVASHPFDAMYYAMNPREEMWGNSNMSYRIKLANEEKHGVDLGTMPFGPMSVLNMTPLQAFNPFKIGTNLRRGYDEGNFLGAVGDELTDMGTSYGLAKGFNALGKGTGFLKPMMKGLNNPLINAGFLAQAPQNFSNAYDEFQAGNYGSAAYDAAMGALGVAPAVSTLKNLNSLRTPGTVAINNIPTSRFTGLYNAATPGSGMAIGNTSLNTAQPAFQSITNPLNKLSKGLGFGEFSVLKQNPGFNSTPNINQLLGYEKGGSYYDDSRDAWVDANGKVGPNGPANYKKGGALPKANFGKIVKSLQSLSVPATELASTTKPLISAAELTKLAPLLKANMPGMQQRLQVANSLKNLGYVGSQFTGTDAFRAAKSDDSLSKLMQLAIDHDRTGYRQVTGEFRPQGNLLGGYGRSTREPNLYDMYKHHYGAPTSEYMNMMMNRVDPHDPLSLAPYQATSIPMQQYGYRAGLPTMSGLDGLYLASLPEKQTYGRYQFKVKQPVDFGSGDWNSLYNDYIANKQSLSRENTYRRDLLPENTYFHVGSSKGKPGVAFNTEEGIANGSGLNTRMWISGKGNKIGEVDPDFKFSDFKKMSLDDYKEMEDYRNSIINQFNTGWRGQYKQGGNLPKANLGQIVKTGSDLSKLLKPASEFRSTLSGLDDLGNLPGIVPTMRTLSKPLASMIQPLVNDVPKIDLQNYANTTGGNSLIRFGTEPHPGNEWYNVDPADYPGLDWKKEGLKDANDSLSKYMSGLPQYGKDLFNGVGAFDFKDFSDGWAARQAMMNMGTDPQWVPGKNDFYTENELTNLVNQQSEWQAARNAFDDMEPEDPGMAIFSALSGDNSREELFSNLFPNASMPNFRSKFTTPSQEALLQQHLPWQYSIKNKGMLNPNSLKNINGLGDTLPRTYQDLLKAQKDNFLTRSPAKDVVMEMRGGLGLKMEDIQNATPEQLEKWRQQIVKKMNTQASDRWTRDSSNPFTGGNAFKQISDVPGWKNKKGGVVTSLSKKEIDQYVKDGYIVEEH